MNNVSSAEEKGEQTVQQSDGDLVAKGW